MTDSTHPRLVRYGKILLDNFAILVGVIRQHVVRADKKKPPYVAVLKKFFKEIKQIVG